MDKPLRKIIHVDMDAFYASIEIRDNPSLKGKPVAVGGTSSNRGVLTTCSYEARQFGCRSAMPTFKALQLCPNLIVVPVRFDAYRRESRRIRDIFHRFTETIEPLSLDEAYLDISHLNSSSSAVAREIRRLIREETKLTASAGIALNKFLAKVASDWNKPDGQFEIKAEEIDNFMRDLPVGRIWGVGKATEAKLHQLQIQTCGDLQSLDLSNLTRLFGKFGAHLHQLCRGHDDRAVEPHRERKSLSNERTFSNDITSLEACEEKLRELHEELVADYQSAHSNRRITKAVVKLKFSDFTQTTAECLSHNLDPTPYFELLAKAWDRGQGKSVRLLGAGVRFAPPPGESHQLEMFD
ncbi:MAG: DNA polymerase IV [Verrucomicrobiota bacterium]